MTRGGDRGDFERSEMGGGRHKAKGQELICSV
jgi:hypothetical protein